MLLVDKYLVISIEIGFISKFSVVDQVVDLHLILKNVTSSQLSVLKGLFKITHKVG